jgi:hypothetical protein
MFANKKRTLCNIKRLFFLIISLNIFILTLYQLDKHQSSPYLLFQSLSYSSYNSDDLISVHPCKDWLYFGHETFFKLGAQYFFVDVGRINLHFISSLRAAQQHFGDVIKLRLHFKRLDDEFDFVLEVNEGVKMKQVVTDFYDLSFAYFTLEAEIDENEPKRHFVGLIDPNENNSWAQIRVSVEVVTSRSGRTAQIGLKVKRFKSRWKSNSTMVCSKCVFELRDRPDNVKDLTSWIRLNRKLGQSFIEVIYKI